MHKDAQSILLIWNWMFRVFTYFWSVSCIPDTMASVQVSTQTGWHAAKLTGYPMHTRDYSLRYQSPYKLDGALLSIEESRWCQYVDRQMHSYKTKNTHNICFITPILLSYPYWYQCVICRWIQVSISMYLF